MKWNEENEAFLVANWGTATARAIAEALGTSRNAVIGKANRMGLRALGRARPITNLWTEAMVKFLTENHGVNSTSWIAECLGLEPRQVSTKAYSIGLVTNHRKAKKTPEKTVEVKKDVVFYDPTLDENGKKIMIEIDTEEKKETWMCAGKGCRLTRQPGRDLCASCHVKTIPKNTRADDVNVGAASAPRWTYGRNYG